MENPHPLKVLRERAGASQHEVAKRAGLSQAKLSLVENHFATLNPEQALAVRKAIVEVTRETSAQVMEAADLRLEEALNEIERNPSKQKVFVMLQESRGFSVLEAAIAVLGRRYPVS